MSTEQDKGTVNILWTGGWDSTFRMIQLAIGGFVVQPYYVIDTGRKSSLKEMEQIQIIKNDLSRKYPDCTINEVNLIEVSTIRIDDKIRNAYNSLINDRYLGPQYIWLAALAGQVERLELCIHKDDKAEYFARRAIESEVGLKSEEKIIFGNFEFPIIDYTKIEMENEARKSGDTEILYKSWFCHDPIRNTPCGICGPCEYAFEEGMGKRFTARGRLYHRHPKLFRKLRRAARKFV